MEIPLNTQKAELLGKSKHLRCLALTLVVVLSIMSCLNCLYESSSESSSGNSGYSGYSNYNNYNNYDPVGTCLRYPRAFAILFYIIYLFECKISGSSSYVSNDLTPYEYANYLNTVKTSAPVLGLKMECYHIKVTTHTTTRVYSNGSTTSSSSSNRNKVVTWTGEVHFPYRACGDLTGEIFGINEQKFTKLKLEKTYLFETAEGAQRFEEVKRNFIHANQNRDLSYEVFPRFEIPGFHDRVFVKARGASKPAYLNSGWFWLASFCLLSWPFRMCLEALAEPRRATIRKLIYV